MDAFELMGRPVPADVNDILQPASRGICGFFTVPGYSRRKLTAGLNIKMSQCDARTYGFLNKGGRHTGVKSCQQQILRTGRPPFTTQRDRLI